MIAGFRGEYSFLSNFHPFERPLVFEGISYKTVEHFYVAMKTKNKRIRKLVALHPSKGLKEFGRNITLRDDWEDVKVSFMLQALRWKFSKYNPTLRRKLVFTKDEYLREDNTWRDTFWGFCVKTCRGKNNLGKLLMQIRSEILEERKLLRAKR